MCVLVVLVNVHTSESACMYQLASLVCLVLVHVHTRFRVCVVLVHVDTRFARVLARMCV